ncbi:hypothetical protein ACOI1H_13425 [Loktanella sp. DJP18]|uniref:hypothetical protein n=1 Tax=Loktanella sp. DJP18 TaxID=3409788 RepID=UPI003BB61919
MTQNTPTRTVLSAADFDTFAEALANPAAPTPAAIAAAQRFSDKVVDGTFTVAGDDEETAAWARDAFTALQAEIAAAGPIKQEFLTPEEIVEARATLVAGNAAAMAALLAVGSRGLHPRVAALRAGTAPKDDDQA